jgi:hypothetical protein
MKQLHGLNPAFCVGDDNAGAGLFASFFAASACVMTGAPSTALET